MIKKTPLKKAQDKLKQHNDNLTGYLTPQEFLILIDNGYKTTPKGWTQKENKEYAQTEIENAKSDKKRGISNPTWYSFLLNKNHPPIKNHDKNEQ